MKLDEETNKKIENLSPILKGAVHYLVDIIDTIISGKCDEKSMVDTMATIHNNAKGKYSDSDVMNYDEAGNELGFGTTNRVGLKKLLDKNGIKQIKINNMPCGFCRSKVMELSHRLDEENLVRYKRRKKKE